MLLGLLVWPWHPVILWLWLQWSSPGSEGAFSILRRPPWWRGCILSEQAGHSDWPPWARVSAFWWDQSTQVGGRGFRDGARRFWNWACWASLARWFSGFWRMMTSRRTNMCNIA